MKLRLLTADDLRQVLPLPVVIDSMKAAKSLYTSLSFRTIEAYRYNPLKNSSYMELELK